MNFCRLFALEPEPVARFLTGFGTVEPVPKKSGLLGSLGGKGKALEAVFFSNGQM